VGEKEERERKNDINQDAGHRDGQIYGIGWIAVVSPLKSKI
jgi:hypothetical protein